MKFQANRKNPNFAVPKIFLGKRYLLIGYCRSKIILHSLFCLIIIYTVYKRFYSCSYKTEGYPFPTQSLVSMTLKNRTFENIVAKGGKWCYPAFSPFPKVFSSLSETEIVTLAELNLSSADTFNLVKAKILRSGKALKVEGIY